MEQLNLFRIAIVVLVLCTSVIEAQQPLKFELYLQKDTYLVGEAIDLGRNIINTSSTTQKIPVGIEIKMVMPNAEIKECFFTRGIWFHQTKELKPGEESYEVMDISRCFGERYCLSHYQFILNPGMYSVTATFHTVSSTDSLRVSFKIVQPEGDESLVLNSYMDLGKNSAKYEFSQYLDAIRSLYHTYPKSVYAQTILDEIRSAYQISLGDSLKAFALGKELLEKYPLTQNGSIWLGDVLKSIPTMEERITYLKKLLPAVKNSPMQKQIEQKLKAEMGE